MTQLFLLPQLSENQLERLAWDNLVIRTDDAMTIAHVADAGPGLGTTDTDDDG